MTDHNSNNNNIVKFPVTRPQQKQDRISINDTVEQNCPKCLGQYFDIVTKLRIFSKLSPKNSSGKDVLIKVEVYLCRNCKHEYGQPTDVGENHIIVQTSLFWHVICLLFPWHSISL